MDVANTPLLFFPLEPFLFSLSEKAQMSLRKNLATGMGMFKGITFCFLPSLVRSSSFMQSLSVFYFILLCLRIRPTDGFGYPSIHISPLSFSLSYSLYNPTPLTNSVWRFPYPSLSYLLLPHSIHLTIPKHATVLSLPRVPKKACCLVCLLLQSAYFSSFLRSLPLSFPLSLSLCLCLCLSLHFHPLTPFNLVWIGFWTERCVLLRKQEEKEKESIKGCLGGCNKNNSPFPLPPFLHLSRSLSPFIGKKSDQEDGLSFIFLHESTFVFFSSI